MRRKTTKLLAASRCVVQNQALMFSAVTTASNRVRPNQDPAGVAGVECLVLGAVCGGALKGRREKTPLYSSARPAIDARGRPGEIWIMLMHITASALGWARLLN